MCVILVLFFQISNNHLLNSFSSSAFQLLPNFQQFTILDNNSQFQDKDLYFFCFGINRRLGLEFLLGRVFFCGINFLCVGGQIMRLSWTFFYIFLMMTRVFFYFYLKIFQLMDFFGGEIKYNMQKKKKKINDQNFLSYKFDFFFFVNYLKRNFGATNVGVGSKFLQDRAIWGTELWTWRWGCKIMK